jgi:hypothetical protein
MALYAHIENFLFLQRGLSVPARMTLCSCWDDPLLLRG